jgi:CheY-like chemotaxis protein
MLIRLTRKLADAIDGIDLSCWTVDDLVEMPDRDARTLIAEGWAERAASDERHPLVLVVEDDKWLRTLYRTALTPRFAVDECPDGMSARAYFDHARPDAIVLDLNLPRLRGETLYNELRHQPLTSAIPVVVVTGVDPTPDVPGATVLRKPCEIDALIEALEVALAAER